jgi:hypothetical protein
MKVALTNRGFLSQEEAPAMNVVKNGLVNRLLGITLDLSSTFLVRVPHKNLLHQSTSLLSHDKNYFAPEALVFRAMNYAQIFPLFGFLV